MFVIQKCESLRDYDLFLEQLPQMNKDLYPKCQDERMVSIDQIPKSIIHILEQEIDFVIKTVFVRCKYDFDEQKQIIGGIEFHSETEKNWLTIIGDYDDWRDYCKLMQGVPL